MRNFILSLCSLIGLIVLSGCYVQSPGFPSTVYYNSGYYDSGYERNYNYYPNGDRNYHATRHPDWPETYYRDYRRHDRRYRHNSIVIPIPSISVPVPEVRIRTYRYPR